MNLRYPKSANDAKLDAQFPKIAARTANGIDFPCFCRQSSESFTYFIYSKFPQSFDKVYTYLNTLAGGVEFTDQPSKIEIKKLPKFKPEKLESDFERQVHYWLTKRMDQRWN